MIPTNIYNFKLSITFAQNKSIRMLKENCKLYLINSE